LRNGAKATEERFKRITFPHGSILWIHHEAVRRGGTEGLCILDVLELPTREAFYEIVSEQIPESINNSNIRNSINVYLYVQ